MEKGMENKKIKVYLQYPWKFPDSPYYKYLINCPPKSISFDNAKKKGGAITNRRFFWLLIILKRKIRKLVKVMNIVIPNARLSPVGNYDLIHCCHCLSKNTNKPWVADIEMMGSFSMPFDQRSKTLEKVGKYLRSKNCKKILPWTKSIEKDILQSFPRFKEKIEVVYPAVPEIKNLKKPKNKNIKIIFIARYFGLKGGEVALEVLERLRKKYNIEGIVVSDVPEKIKLKYPKIKIHGLVSQKELFKIMTSSDIFLYPSLMDTFGFSLLEAMSFGLPIITVDTNWTKSRKEIVEDGKNGFIFDIKEKMYSGELRRDKEIVIRKLVENTSKLINDRNLREKMSKECIKTIKEGKFSMKNRNEKLDRIYKNALEYEKVY